MYHGKSDYLKSAFILQACVRQSFLTAAGLAGGVTLETGGGPLVFVEAWRAALQALPRVLHVHVALPAAQTLCVSTTGTLAAGGVASLTNLRARVAEVTEKQIERVSLMATINEAPSRQMCVV